MAREYRPVDRDQAFLLPPDMRDWLPDDHLVWFVLDVAAVLDTSALHARYRLGGAGRAAYDPDMLLALVVYAWSQGVRSSRQIERLCQVDVAFRVLCAGDTPDHCTTSRFVAGCQDAVTDLFAQVLELCARAGLLRLGQVAVDGTKVAANASLGANRTATSVREEFDRHVAAERARTDARPGSAGTGPPGSSSGPPGDPDPAADGSGWAAAEAAAAAVAEQVATDAAEDTEHGQARGDELPGRLADRRGRPARLRDALAELATRPPARVGRQRPDASTDPDPDVLATGRGKRGRRRPGPGQVAEARAIHDRHLAEAQARWDAWHTANPTGERRRGGRPVPPDRHCRVVAARANLARAEAAAKAQAARQTRAAAEEKVNVTDPDSRVMQTRTGWVQSYNAQVAVTDDHLILTETVTQDTNDTAQLVPMTDAAVTAAARLPVSLLKDHPTLILLVTADNGYWTPEAATAPGPDRLIATANRRDLAKHPAPHSPPPDDATPLQTMTHRLATPEGRTRYKRRGATVEPVIGQIKDVTGLRRFRRRGLPAVRAEFTLTCTIHNLLKLFRATHPEPG